MNNQQQFNSMGCLFVSNFIDAQTISVVSKYLENKIKRGEWVEKAESEDLVSKYSYYADPLVEILLLDAKPAVENLIGRDLIPTYSYARVYQPGELLKPHTDREACEISVTVNVATKGEISPVYTQYKGNKTEQHILNPGDAVIYFGCETVHWRKRLTQDQLNVQFMLHYVVKNGPNAKHAKDLRASYGENIIHGG